MKKIFRLIVVSALVATIGNSAVAQNYNEENNLFYHAFRAPQANDGENTTPSDKVGIQ